jgi:hypothetical protein
LSDLATRHRRVVAVLYLIVLLFCAGAIAVAVTGEGWLGLTRCSSRSRSSRHAPARPALSGARPRRRARRRPAPAPPHLAAELRGGGAAAADAAVAESAATAEERPNPRREAPIILKIHQTMVEFRKHHELKAKIHLSWWFFQLYFSWWSKEPKPGEA